MEKTIDSCPGVGVLFRSTLSRRRERERGREDYTWTAALSAVDVLGQPGSENKFDEGGKYISTFYSQWSE